MNMEEFQAGGGANYEENMKKFIDIYGITLKVPGMYLYDSKLNPSDHTQLLQIVNYVNPKDTDDDTYTVVTHSNDDDTGNILKNKTHMLSSIYTDEKYDDSMVLRLLTNKEGRLDIIEEF